MFFKVCGQFNMQWHTIAAFDSFES